MLFGPHRTGRLPVASAAVDAADLGLRAGEGETLKIWPETQGRRIKENNKTETFFTLRGFIIQISMLTFSFGGPF